MEFILAQFDAIKLSGIVGDTVAQQQADWQ